MTLGWLNYRTFDVADYEHHEKIENGDFNWIIPGKFLAMSSPHPSNYDLCGIRLFTPEDYVPVFKEIGVTAVVRLNNETYDARRFTEHGVNVHELFFVDGTCPPEAIV
jgi:cell division cycle 14